MMPMPAIKALRAIHMNRIRLPKEHVPSVHAGGLGLGSPGHGLSGTGRVQGAPRMNLRIPSFIRRPQL